MSSTPMSDTKGAGTATSTGRLRRAGADARVRGPHRRRHPGPRRAGRPGHGHRRPERLRQVDHPARARPAPQTARRGRAPRRHRAVEDPHPEDRPVDRTAAADPGGPGGDHRHRPRRPRASAAPALVAAVVGGGRAGGDGRDGAYGHHRARRPVRGRTVRRSAPAGLDRDGARPGDRSAAARRADHVPRHRAPGRGTGPGAPTHRAAWRTAPAAGPSSPCSTTSTRPPGTRTTWSP